MKSLLIVMLCTVGTAACGAEQRSADDPSAVTSTSTTTNARPELNAGDPSIVTTPARTAPASEARRTASNGSNDATRATTADATKTSSDAPVTTGAAPAAAPVANNPGVANGTKDADNTKINDRDRHGALTPMDQGGGKDRDITAAIRRSVVGDKALSFTAKNVKIITVGGKVTLRGPVKSDEEKSAIEAKAKSTAGVSEVDNQLEIKK